MFVLHKWVNLVFVISCWLEVEILRFYNFIIFKTFAYICIPFIYLKCLHLTIFYFHPNLIFTIHDQGCYILLFLAHVLPSTKWIQSIKLYEMELCLCRGDYHFLICIRQLPWATNQFIPPKFLRLKFKLIHSYLKIILTSKKHQISKERRRKKITYTK